MKPMTPQEIVKELDKYIVGQEQAKRAVAIAIRNRWRRQQLPEDIRDDVIPKNILMIGPTGVGKTEIARRLSSLIKAPFIKVEATKFTEVGYHGRDVDAIIRDLMDISMDMVRKEKIEEVRKKVKRKVENRVLDLLLPGYPESSGEQKNRMKSTREKLRKKLRAKELEEQEIEIPVKNKVSPVIEIFSNTGVDQMGFDFQDMVERLTPTSSKYVKMSIREARHYLEQEESERFINKEDIQKESITRVENMGLVFIDEIDKIAGPRSPHGPDVSREGVQRDLLPIIEGTSVATRYGLIKTDHILFIAAGAFHVSKPSELIPELQGRFPIRVELSDLSEEDLYRILTEPKNALTKQYQALVETEGLCLKFTKEALKKVTETAARVNQITQNIGARRLHTIMERLLEEVLFEAPNLGEKTITIDKKQVDEKLSGIISNEDLTHFIL